MMKPKPKDANKSLLNSRQNPLNVSSEHADSTPALQPKPLYDASLYRNRPSAVNLPPVSSTNMSIELRHSPSHKKSPVPLSEKDASLLSE
jgi:hypothetical protein